MAYLKHFLVLNIFIIFTKSINEKELPVTNFDKGTRVRAGGGSHALTSVIRISSGEIDAIHTHIPTGSIDLKRTGAVVYVINVYKPGASFGGGGKIYYKEVTDQSDVSALMSGMPDVYRDSVTQTIKGLNPNWAFVATWSKVKVSLTGTENTFQVVLLSNNTHTVALLAYVSPLVLQGNSVEASLTSYNLPGSGTSEVVKLSEDSNFLTNGVTGLWLYPLYINQGNNFNSPCTKLPVDDSQRCNKDLVCTAGQGKGFGRCLCPGGLVLEGDNSCIQPTSTSTDKPETTISDNDTTLYAILIACVCAVGILVSVCCIKKYIARKRRDNTTTVVSSEENGSSSKSSGKSTDSKKGFASIMDMLMKRERYNVDGSVDSDDTDSSKAASSAANSSGTRSSGEASSSGGKASSKGTSSEGTSSKGTSSTEKSSSSNETSKSR